MQKLSEVFSILGLLLVISKADQTCQPVNLKVHISEINLKDHGSVGTAVEDIAKHLPPSSNMSVGMENDPPFFTGVMPEDIPRLQEELERFKQNKLPAKRSVGSISQYLQDDCIGNCSSAQLRVVFVYGQSGGQHKWNRDLITTVVQLKAMGNYSEQWQSITADNDHYLVVDKEGSIPVPNITSLICKDSSRLCGTTQYMYTDRETIVCRSCNSICSSDYTESHCTKWCPYYKPPVLPKPTGTVITNPTLVNDSLTAGETGGIIAGIVVIAGIAAIIIYCVVRRRRRQRQKGQPFFRNTGSSSPTQEYQPVPTREGTPAGDRTTGFSTAGDQTVTSSSAGDQTATSSTAGDQTATSSTAGDQTATSSSAGDQTTASSTAGDQTAASSTAGDQTAASSTARDQTTASSTDRNRPTASSTDGNHLARSSTAGYQATGCCSSGNQPEDAVLYGGEIELNVYSLNGPMSTVHGSE